MPIYFVLCVGFNEPIDGRQHPAEKVSQDSNEIIFFVRSTGVESLLSSFALAEGPPRLVGAVPQEVELRWRPANDSGNISCVVPWSTWSSPFLLLYRLSLSLLSLRVGEVGKRKSPPLTFCVNSSATIFAVTL